MADMNGFATAFLIINAMALLVLPRRIAPLPLIVTACYMTLGQGIKLGPFSFPIIRLLLGVGFTRVILRGERLDGGLNGLDRLMLIWAGCAVLSSIFHRSPIDNLINMLGLVYNTCGVYFLLRFFCQSIADVIRLCSYIAIVLLPVACEMVFEVISAHNAFSLFGGLSEIPAIREGRIRAQGPFAHAILAGTVGAVCLPLMIGLWQIHKNAALIGIVSCVLMIFACASSGPIMSALSALIALLFWHKRHQMRLVRRIALFAYLALDLVMKAPAYYVLAHIDLTGGSTGWHRAELIRSALAHLHEWWLAGTDYTRHWMPTGVSWSPDHCDITNHYIFLGVRGGLPFMLLFIACLAKGFSYVGRIIWDAPELPSELKFMTWAMGVSLFAHATTSISVAYFDQSFLFLYLTLAAISSSWSNIMAVQVAEKMGDSTNGVSCVERLYNRHSLISGGIP